ASGASLLCPPRSSRDDSMDRLSPRPCGAKRRSSGGLLPDALFAALVRGRDRAGRKGRDGGEVCWQLARQAFQKLSLVSASPGVTPSCTRAMTRTASGSVATDPS